MLKQRTKLKVKSPRRQISRSRSNRAVFSRQRSYFLQNIDQVFHSENEN